MNRKELKAEEMNMVYAGQGLYFENVAFVSEEMPGDFGLANDVAAVI